MPPQTTYLPGLEPANSTSDAAPPLAILRPGLLSTEQVLAKYRDLRGGAQSTRETKRQLVRWRATHDLFWFGDTFLGLGEFVDPVNKRQRVDPILHGDLCKQLAARTSILILLPRDHGKSTWVTVTVAQDLLANPDYVRTLIISASVTLARARLRYLADLLTRPAVLYYFADIIPEPGRGFTNWDVKNAYDLTVRKSPNRLEAQHQVMVCGYEALITGHHFDHIICDDVVDEKTARSETKRQLAAERLTGLNALKEPTGRFTVIGTRYHEDDVYSRLLNSTLLETHVVRQATERPPEVATEPVPDGVTAGALEDPWSAPIYAFYDKEMLNLAKEAAYDLTGRHEWFYTQYYNQARAPSEAVFPDPQKHTYEDIPVNVLTTCEVFIALDTANTQNVTSDLNAIAVGYREPQGTVFIEDTEALKGTWEDAARALVGMMLKHPPRGVAVETTFADNWLAMFRRVLSDILRDLDYDPPRLPTPEIVLPRRGQNKEERIDLLFGSAFRTGTVVVQRDQTELLAQMASFPKGRHDDLVDATATVCALAEPSQRYVTYYERPKPPPNRFEMFLHRNRKSGYRYGENLAGYLA